MSKKSPFQVRYRWRRWFNLYLINWKYGFNLWKVFLYIIFQWDKWWEHYKPVMFLEHYLHCSFFFASRLGAPASLIRFSTFWIAFSWPDNLKYDYQGAFRQFGAGSIWRFYQDGNFRTFKGQSSYVELWCVSYWVAVQNMKGQGHKSLGYRNKDSQRCFLPENILPWKKLQEYSFFSPKKNLKVSGESRAAG